VKENRISQWYVYWKHPFHKGKWAETD